MKYDKIYNFDAEYASQVLDTIPTGYVDKTATGIGLTTLIIENKEDAIVLVPNIALAHNKATQYPNERCNYKVLAVWGDVAKEAIDKYLDEVKGNQPIKILSTYDSLYKVEHHLPKCKIVIDESQKILDLTKGNRRDAILYMLNMAKKYKDNTSFISATPIDLEFMPEWIGKLPQIKMNWANSITAKPILAKRTYPYKSLREEFIIPLKRDGEMTVAGYTYRKVVVFLNSVSTIQRIIRECKLNIDECSIIVGDAIKNDKLLKGINRYKVGDDFKYLFITSTGFQGIDIYDKEAMTIAVSSTNKSYTMMELKTDLQQAISRNRSKDNPNYGRYIFIYNQSLFSKSEEELLNIVNRTETLVDNTIPFMNSLIKRGLDYPQDPEVLEYSYKNEDGYFRKNEMAFNADKRFIIKTRRQFTEGFKVAGVTGSIDSLEPVKLPKDVTFEEMALMFKKNHKKGKIDWGIYSTRTNWITTIESLYRLTGRITTNFTYAKEALDAHGDEYKELLFELRNQFKFNTEYTIKDVNNKLQTVYDRHKLNRRAKSSDLYEIFGEKKVEVFRTATSRGIIISK